jgi:hypothetical protein
MSSFSEEIHVSLLWAGRYGVSMKIWAMPENLW